MVTNGLIYTQRVTRWWRRYDNYTSLHGAVPPLKGFVRCHGSSVAFRLSVDAVSIPAGIIATPDAFIQCGGPGASCRLWAASNSTPLCNSLHLDTALLMGQAQMQASSRRLTLTHSAAAPPALGRAASWARLARTASGLAHPDNAPQVQLLHALDDAAQDRFKCSDSPDMPAKALRMLHDGI